MRYWKHKSKRRVISVNKFIEMSKTNWVEISKEDFERIRSEIDAEPLQVKLLTLEVE